MTKNTDKIVSFKVEKELHILIKKISLITDKSIGDIARSALKIYLTKYKKRLQNKNISL